MKEYRISFIGAGKVASALCRQFYLSDCRIIKIVSKSEKSSRNLASTCNASWSSDYSFTGSEDIIITAVPDDALREVLPKVKCSSDSIVVHTAGSQGLDVFPSGLKHTGVFYPLQTFTQGRPVRFKDLPFFLEASDQVSSDLMTDLASLLGGEVHFTDHSERQIIHLAAVFACNFPNHMFTVCKKITEKAGLSFNIMKPLINETVSKALELGPENSQTGPAFRSDKETIKRHIDLLSFSPELQKIYEDITESIIRKYSKATNDDQF
ncbi:MAG: DUF2520 domain-containing protein [Bacteroidales bacterium]|nr:DUF2520 domain-containing protein [Bacteroidales bacterium]